MNASDSQNFEFLQKGRLNSQKTFGQDAGPFSAPGPFAPPENGIRVPEIGSLWRLAASGIGCDESETCRLFDFVDETDATLVTASVKRSRKP